MKRLLILTLLGFFACEKQSVDIVDPIEPPSVSVEMEPSDHSWVIDLEETEIIFDALEKGKPFQGRFNRFDLAVNLDLENPESGHIISIIDLTSVDGGNADRDQVLKDSEMFYVRKFPTARFESKKIVRVSEDRYEAKGELSLKGLSKNIVLPFSISQSGENAIVTAVYNMNRLDFNIGTGSFMSEKFVGYPVTIRIEVEARKANVEKSLQ